MFHGFPSITQKYRKAWYRPEVIWAPAQRPGSTACGGRRQENTGGLEKVLEPGWFHSGRMHRKSTSFEEREQNHAALEPLI